VGGVGEIGFVLHKSLGKVRVFLVNSEEKLVKVGVFWCICEEKCALLVGK
jgi:hypothetical protein